MTSDQFVTMRHPDNTCLSCRGVHRSSPLSDCLGHDDASGSQPETRFGWSTRRSSSHFAKTTIHHPGSRCQIELFLASRVLGTADGIFCMFLQIYVYRGYPEKLSPRGHRSGETVLLIVCTKSPLDRRVSSSLETIVVRRTRQRNTGCQCQLRMVVGQLPGQTFADSNSPGLLWPMKLTRSRQKTRTSTLAHSRSSLLQERRVEVDCQNRDSLKRRRVFLSCTLGGPGARNFDAGTRFQAPFLV